MSASVLSVNLGRPAADRGKPQNTTGIDKQPVASAQVARRSPLAGQYVSNVPPSEAGFHWPSINREYES